jgi:hypothetical protein
MLKRLTMILICVLAISTLGSAQDVPAPQPPAAAQPSQPVRSTAAQLANIRIELTIAEQRSDTSGTPKIVTMVVEDRQSGRIRTGRGNTNLNVDGRAEILREGRIRVVLSVEYAPQDGPERAAPMPVLESITALLEDGKPLVVSQSADPSGDRKVRLELKATIVR